MDLDKLKYLKDKDTENISEILQQFNSENAELFKFEKLQENDLWMELWEAVCAILKDDELERYHIDCLNTIRILSRDEASLLKNSIVEDVRCLLRLARLNAGTFNSSECQSQEHVSSSGNVIMFSATTPDILNSELSDIRIVEALKCLCNLVFQNAYVRRECVRQNMVDQIFKRLSSTVQLESSIELFDMKLLFLITALESGVRSRVLIELNGLTYLTEVLDEKLRHQKQISEETFDVLIELLKVMFNITSCTDKSPSENEIQSLHLTSVVRDILLRFRAMKNDRERLVVSHSIDLLTNISSSCLSELMVKCECTTGALVDSIHVYENRNVSALDTLLNHLHFVLTESEKNPTNNKELAQPVLTVLVKCVLSNATMRHYVRSVILPPLKEVYKRPEEGDELRNQLCRLQTSANMVVRNLSYELLLVCCKKNPSRLIKHFGYGNMAGLFAGAGLMDCRKTQSDEFSSDSEDSDTEEYKQIKHAINPVIGCYMPPAPNPLEDMTEEQKEYEAEKLANLVDQLHRGGLIKPCRINAEGKPEPVEHILELQEELPQQQVQQKGKE